VADALMAIWMVKLNNNTRGQGLGFRSGTGVPVDLAGGGGGSPRYATGHSRAFFGSSPSTPFIHSPGTASPTRTGPGLPGILGMPFGGAGPVTGSLSPSQSQAVYLTQLQLQAQAQAHARAQSQSQSASPVSQSPTRARPNPVAGTPPILPASSRPPSPEAPLSSPPTPLAKKGIPQNARTLPFPLVSPIRTSHPHPHTPPPDTQGIEGILRSLSSPAAGLGAVLAPASLPMPVPVSASEADAGAEAAAAAECELSEAENGAYTGDHKGAEARNRRGSEESESGSGRGSGGGRGLTLSL